MNGNIKSLLGSIVVIGITVALITVGTHTYFTDTEINKKNIFTAGTIDISINPKNGQQVTTLAGDLDLKPCQTGYIKILIHNDGTNPCEVWKHIYNVENKENGVVEPEREYYKEHPESKNYRISDWIHYDMLVCKLPKPEEITVVDDSGVEYTITKEVDCEKVTWTIEHVYEGLQLVIIKGEGKAFRIDWSMNGPVYYIWKDGGDGGWVQKPMPEGITVTVDPYGTAKIEVLVKYIGGCGKIFYWGIIVDGCQYPPNWGGTENPFTDPAENQLGEKILVIPEKEGWFLTTNETLQHEGVECHWIYLGILEPCEYMCVIQSYHLNYTVDNWGQSDKVTFDIEFLAQQIEGALPPEPDPVLEGHGRPD